MRHLLSFICLIFLGLGASAEPAPPTTDEVDAFFRSVATSGATAVEAALQSKPALATASDEYGFQAVHALDYIDFAKNLNLLMRSGADINAQNDDGHSLLHILVDPEFLPIVLKAGADIELRDWQGRTPLMLALMEANNLDMIDALLNAGADPDTRDNSGQTAIDVAREHADDATVQRLARAAAAK